MDSTLTPPCDVQDETRACLLPGSSWDRGGTGAEGTSQWQGFCMGRGRSCKGWSRTSRTPGIYCPMGSPESLGHPDKSTQMCFEFLIFCIFQQGDLLQWHTDLQASHQQCQGYLFLWLFTFCFCEQAFDPSNNPNPNVPKVNRCTVLNSLVTPWIRLIEPVMNRVSIVNSHS